MQIANSPNIGRIYGGSESPARFIKRAMKEFRSLLTLLQELAASTEKVCDRLDAIETSEFIKA